jgi:hypothetical protein
MKTEELATLGELTTLEALPGIEELFGKLDGGFFCKQISFTVA